MRSEQNTGAQTKRLANNQSQTAPVAYENPLTSRQQQEELRRAKENGRMHQPL
jgi:hypothetical protein